MQTLGRRTKQFIALAAVLASIVVGGASSIPGLPSGAVVTMIAVSVGIGFPAAIAQHRLAGAYCRTFDPTEWQRAGQDWKLVVHARDHGKGVAPSATVYQRHADGSHEAVDCNIHSEPNGDLTIYISGYGGVDRRFTGQVRIV